MLEVIGIWSSGPEYSDTDSGCRLCSSSDYVLLVGCMRSLTALVHCTAVDCGPVDVVDNAVLSSMKSTTYNNSVTFHCVAGYWFHRGVYVITSTCRADALWTSLHLHACQRQSIYIDQSTEISNSVSMKC